MFGIRIARFIIGTTIQPSLIRDASGTTPSQRRCLTDCGWLFSTVNPEQYTGSRLTGTLNATFCRRKQSARLSSVNNVQCKRDAVNYLQSRSNWYKQPASKL